MRQVVEQYMDVFEGESMLEDELHFHVDYNANQLLHLRESAKSSLRDWLTEELFQHQQNGFHLQLW